MSRTAWTLAVGGALAVAGCAATTPSGADLAARHLRACLDGRSFWFAPSTTSRAAARLRLGTIHAAEATLTKETGDAGLVDADYALSYDLDAAGARVLARHGLCAPGTRCFPANATATLAPGDAGAYGYSLSAIDTFAPYAGGRVIALAPLELDAGDGAAGGCRT